MTNFFPTFHDSYDRGLDFELSVSFDCIVGIGLFLGCFFKLDLVYFETEKRGCEGLV